MSFRQLAKRIYSKQIDSILRQKVATNNPQQILALLKQDSSNNFRHYAFVKSQFEKYISSQHQNKQPNQSSQQLKTLQQTLSTISAYPMFQLDPKTLRNFTQIVAYNIHLKHNQLLQAALIFLIASDPHVQTSPVYIEFVKFYVKDNIELIKSQLSIDLQQENLLNTIKLFFFRLFQRGFLPRQPTYVRQLYINNHTLLLNKIVQNKTLLNSLILKKIHHQNFIQVKEFYQTEMKENLYHHKNKILLDKLVHLVPYLCKSFQLQIQLIEPECKQLRELYAKQFLVIEDPDLTNCIIFYDMVVNSHPELANQEAKDSNARQSLLSDFLRKVEQIFQAIESFKSQEGGKNEQQMGINIRNEELLLIIKNFSSLNLSLLGLNQLLCELAVRVQSAVVLKRHFSQLIGLINKLLPLKVDLSALQLTLSGQGTFELLDLNESVQLSEHPLVSDNDRIKIAVSKSIEKKDILHVGSEQIFNLLKLYLNLSLSNPDSDFQHFTRQQTLIKFILRFLSDQHPNLPFDPPFQSILSILFGVHSNPKFSVDILDKDFNDPDNNYPNTILQELQNHIKKNTWKIRNSVLKKAIEQKLKP